MTCPRCGDEPMLGAIVPGGPRVFCVNGPFGWPCGEQILPTPHVKRDPSRANRGMALERAVSVACDFYAREKLARVSKRKTAAVASPGGKFRWAKHNRPDFDGVLAGGRAIAFEAKSDRGPSLPLERFEAQRKRLTKLMEIGGVAGAVIRLRDRSEGEAEWWIDWSRVLSFAGRASIPEAYLEQHGRRVPRRWFGQALGVMWLDAIDESIRRTG